MLCTFRANEPARIETDASDLAIGACLCQKDITEKPILKQEKDGSLVPIQSLAVTMRITVQDIALTLKEGYVNDKLAS